MPTLAAPPRPGLQAPAPRHAAPDVGAAAVPLLRRLRDALHAATPAPDRWGVPVLFFFRPELQREWAAARPAPRAALDAPTRDLVDDAVSVLAGSADARKAARATPGLAAAVAAVAPLVPRVKELAGLLAVLDDEVIRAVHPDAGIGWRVRVRGVADVGQFHCLLADAVTGSPARGKLPGPRPDPRAVAAYRGQGTISTGTTADGPAVMTARFQLLAPTALAAGLPAGPEGAGHWLFPAQPLRRVPRTPSGERAVVLAEPVLRAAWPAEPGVPRVAAALDVLATMTAAEVRDWVAEHGGRAEARRAAIRRRVWSSRPFLVRSGHG